ncbi:MAG: hypothetical protein BAJATHORv1_30360 [Candidatus Thorarchaeota archaeon]|nr:MAG: hypothetical protein BAJATHORv1_30360 [Candidatus Thorarchaeota archaeon]
MTEFRVTLLQIPCIEGNREKNYDRVWKLLESHPYNDPLEFIVLPELFAIGFRHEDYGKLGPGIPGPTENFLHKLAEEHGVYTIATGIESAGSKWYNTMLVAGPNGKTIGKYQKIHPFQEEKAVFKGGERLVIFDIEGLKVGAQICYDVRFPEISRKLALEGAELFIIPAAFPDPRGEHWDTLIRARAIENQVFVAATNRMGLSFDGKTYFGHTQFVDPWGVRRTRINSEERVVSDVGNTDAIEGVRNQITVYQDRVSEAYDRFEIIKA